jgi:methyl-accepting chemotaxis protein
MFGIDKKQMAALRVLVTELKATAAAIDRSQAVIEFQLDGTIIEANENFLATMGYRMDEIAGRHHSMFVDPADAASPQYARFWERLRAGEFFADAYKRVGAGGAEIWFRAPTTPYSTPRANPTRSSSSPPTLPRRDVNKPLAWPSATAPRPPRRWWCRRWLIAWGAWPTVI